MDKPLHQPPTLDELKHLRRKLRRVDIQQKEKLSRLERVAIFISAHIGSAGFFLILLCVTAGWLGWNIFAPEALRFDPSPAFVIWLFVMNIFQFMLMPLIMISQNLNNRHSDARAEADFEINTKAEFEIEVILQHLENQNELILKILNRVEHRH